MKSLVLAIVISLAVLPARAQFFKKLKDETAQRLKDKLAMKKDQKIDEQTEKASNKIMAVPDTVVQKTGRALKKKKEKEKEKEEKPMVDSAAVQMTASADTVTHSNR